MNEEASSVGTSDEQGARIGMHPASSRGLVLVDDKYGTRQAKQSEEYSTKVDSWTGA